jgi:hypothetical protein
MQYSLTHHGHHPHHFFFMMLVTMYFIIEQYPTGALYTHLLYGICTFILFFHLFFILLCGCIVF